MSLSSNYILRTSLWGALALGGIVLVWKVAGLESVFQDETLSNEVLVQESRAAITATAQLIAEADKAKVSNVDVPPEFRGKTLEDVTLAPEQKYVALTFDDGPWPKTTNSILYTLKSYGVRATFFVVGSHAQNFPGELKKIVDEGHVLANHTWNHRYHQHSPAQAASEFKRTDDLIYKHTKVRTKLFRPPGGHLKNGLVQYAAQNQYTTLMWSVDSGDTTRISASSILNNILAKTKAGGIVLMHDGGGDRIKTASMLPQAIAELQSRGFEFVTIPELLELAAQHKANSTAQKPAQPVTSN